MSRAQDPGGADLGDVAERNPIAHPTIASLTLFDYSLPPGDHLKEAYHALFQAVSSRYPDAPKKVARLMPRGHGKSEGLGVVFPTWCLLRHPEIRVAVISKTAGLADERASKVVEKVEQYADTFGIEIDSGASTQLTTAANTHKEPSISGYGLESQLTGKHFDVLVWDDIADWENQRTETQRRAVRDYFRDYSRNLIDPDSELEGGGVQAMIGTRKHVNDIYATDVLDAPTWDSEVRKAIRETDWPLVDDRAWDVRGDDGELYDSIADLPADVNLANNGVVPEREIRVLWPDHKPPEALLYDVVGGDDSIPIWRRENQQDPHALSGEVFDSEWLTYVDALPQPASSYRWYAGVDIALVDDLQQAVEQDSDYTALAVVAWAPGDDRGYLVRLERERGLSVQATAEWVAEHLAVVDAGIDQVLVEQNANRGVAQRLRDDHPYPAEGTTSSGSKEERIHNMAADFESGDLRIVGSPGDETWRSFETDEWLQFPNAPHDDRLDAIEIALRCVDDTDGEAFLLAT